MATPIKWHGKASKIHGKALKSDQDCCCACGCGSKGEPAGNVTVTFYTDECVALNGISYELIRIGGQVWRLSTNDDSCFGDSIIELACSLYDPYGSVDSYTLSVKWLPNPNPVPCFTSSEADPLMCHWGPPSGTCDPFDLVFPESVIYAVWWGQESEGPYDCCECENGLAIDMSAEIVP
jgi:hypothetical protein